MKISLQSDNLENLKFLIRCFIVEFVINDMLQLLERDVHEVAITHRIALYLEPKFKGYNVDLEYNRDEEEPKRVKRVRKIMMNEDEQNIRPDIIIHRRGTNDGNLCVIEVKKDASSDEDIKKIKAIIRKYNYKLGLFLNITLKRLEFYWFYHDESELWMEKEIINIEKE